MSQPPTAAHPTPPRRSKYQLKHLVRVNLAGSDEGFNCVYQTNDEYGEAARRA